LIGTTLTVNATDDTNDSVCDGTHCSLREAISAASAAGDADMTTFSVGGIFNGGTLAVANSTFANNSASFGGHAISPDARTTIGCSNSENAAQAWGFYRDLVHKYQVAPSATDLTTATNDELFREGKLDIQSELDRPAIEADECLMTER
jgi:CSLREA domain-containing protein